MRRSKLFSFVVSLLLTAAGANAAELYVSLSGNDANAGTLSAPFRTIKQASRVARSGDVVNVRGGVYADATTTTIYQLKGTASARIVFRSMPGELAILDGTNLPASGNIITFNETEFVDFSGFEVRNAKSQAVVVWHGKNTRILDNHIHHAVRNGIYVGGDVTPACSDITVSGNRVHDTVLENQYHTFNGGWAAAVVVSRTDGATITDNTIYNNDGEGLISLRSNYATIRNNEIHDNFSASLYVDNARFVTADRNLIYSTGNTRYFRDGKPGIGIGVANEVKDQPNPSSDNVFTNNIVIGTRWGFYYGNFESGGGLHNTKVVNNTFYGTVDEIIRIDNDTHSNSVVQNNIFYAVGSVAPRYSGAGSGVTYANNLCADPMFVKPGSTAAADYRIRTGSGAMAKALNVASLVATDYFAAPRVTPFDIGAHQLSTAAAADVVPPSVPLNLRATNGDASSVTLVWDASTDNTRVASYTILRNGVQVATAGSTTWTDTAVAEETQYSYQVQAVDAAGNRSAASAVLTLAWSSTDAKAPAAPPELSLRDVTATSVEIAWKDVADDVAVTEYRIYRNNLPVRATQSYRFTDTGLQALTTYTYEVVAVDAAGNARISNTITVTTKAAGKKRAARR
jgi:parallel beta-helix repeat protein